MNLIHLIEKSIRKRATRTLLLVGTVLIVSSAVALLLSAAETSRVTVDKDLAQYWRTSYDILVRPPGSRSDIEEKYGLVQGNHLSGISGGITFEQFEEIKQIPGVEVAAPISMIGYMPVAASGAPLEFPADPTGIYVLKEELIVDDGIKKHQPLGYPRLRYFMFDPLVSDSGIMSSVSPNSNMSFYLNPPFSIIKGTVHFHLLMAAIDPSQEAALIGLDKAVIAGTYLQAGQSIITQDEIDAQSDTVELNRDTIEVPVLVNSETYIDFIHHEDLCWLQYSDEFTWSQELVSEGGISGLQSLACTPISSAETKSEDVYRQMTQDMISGRIIFFQEGSRLPSPINYEEGAPPFETDEISLEVVVSANEGDPSRPIYRSDPGDDSIQFVHPVRLQPVGVIDIGKLGTGESINPIPLETFFPAEAILEFNEEGDPLNPSILKPTFDPRGYLQSPPFLLTTLETAKHLRGDASISAIRVRVAGIDRFDPAAQAKIESVASEILEATGLDVDVVVGSSPRRVQVHIPGVGYVDELWIQKGVTLSYSSKIEHLNQLFFVLILSVCTLSILNTALMSTLGRGKEISLQKALGWRSSTVFRMILMEMGIVGVASGALGVILAWSIAEFSGFQLAQERLVLIFPLSIALCLLGGLIPGMSAARVKPALMLHDGTLRNVPAWHSKRFSVTGYVLQALSRRRIRALLTIGTMALSGGLLTVLLGASLGLRDYLFGTLLGEYVLLRIEGYHYVMAGISILVAGTTGVDSLLVAAFERRREIGLLKSVGWRSRDVFKLFLFEGVFVGLAGGTIGAFIGASLLLIITRIIPDGFGYVISISIGLPCIIGTLAALFPGFIASRTLPGDALRYE